MLVNGVKKLSRLVTLRGKHFYLLANKLSNLVDLIKAYALLYFS